VIIPEVGGDTIFAISAPFMPDSPLPCGIFWPVFEARHDFAKSFLSEDTPARPIARNDRTRRTHRPVSHPVVRSPSGDRRERLVRQRRIQLAVEAWRRTESDALLTFLFQHAENPNSPIAQMASGACCSGITASPHYAVGRYCRTVAGCIGRRFLGDRPV